MLSESRKIVRYTRVKQKKSICAECIVQIHQKGSEERNLAGLENERIYTKKKK